MYGTMKRIELSIFLDKTDVHRSGIEYTAPDNLLPMRDEQMDIMIEKTAKGNTILYLFISTPFFL